MKEESRLIARRCFVSGRVQGVFYRGATRHKAMELGCRGYAHNLRDGRVEVLLIGPEQAVERVIAWLWQGPPSAHVTDVEVQTLELDDLADPPSGFSTR